MTLLTAVRDVLCRSDRIFPPTSIFSGASTPTAPCRRWCRLPLKLAAAHCLRNTETGSQLKKTATMTGDGVTTSVPVAGRTFKRMLVTSNVWMSTNDTDADAVCARHRRVDEPSRP